MGYLLFAVLIVVAIGLLAAAFARNRPPSGTLPHTKPVVVEKPAAEEPTPGASNLAPPKQAEQASRRTPPA